MNKLDNAIYYTLRYQLEELDKIFANKDLIYKNYETLKANINASYIKTSKNHKSSTLVNSNSWYSVYGLELKHKNVSYTISR